MWRENSRVCGLVTSPFKEEIAKVNTINNKQQILKVWLLRLAGGTVLFLYHVLDPYCSHIILKVRMSRA